jgi:hypothetical protein
MTSSRRFGAKFDLWADLEKLIHSCPTSQQPADRFMLPETQKAARKCAAASW